MKFKTLFILGSLSVSAIALQGCSTNAATGKQQFTALMSPAQENSIGAEEHQKIVQQFGLYQNQAVASYVSQIGARVTQKTERPDVQYKFFVLDSPIVNAFALPGGYIYISRGLLALANSEAEVAAVLSHEAGHITGRHSAERYSRGVVTSLGAGILSAAIGTPGVGQALGTGAQLYLNSYSRGQENEADSLGLRYMTQGGYHPAEMSKFLSSLSAQSNIDARLAGQKGNEFSYLSTHPATGERVQKTLGESNSYPQKGAVNRDGYLQKINGITYGDSASQGFVRGNSFYHPGLGFTFDAPAGYRFVNQPNQVIATDNKGAIIIFDMARRTNGQVASSYISQTWIKDKPVKVENMSVNGMRAATTSFEGQVNGKPATLRLIAIEFNDGSFARFQIAIPQGASAATVEGLQRSSYSFRPLSAQERESIKPHRLRLVQARAGDTIASMARAMPFNELKEERFRVLNGLLPNESLVAGRLYKTVSD